MSLLPRIVKGWFGDPAPRRAAALDVAVWESVVARYPFLQALSMPEATRLAEMSATLLELVVVHGAGAVVLDESIRVAIAAQACLPVLELGLSAYPRMAEIIVYPGDFVVQREITDDAGVVHEWSESIAGEAWEGGPVVLSWDAASGLGEAQRSFNVVIHEFAHKLDMTNGAMDGMPRFSRTLHAELDAQRWLRIMDTAYQDFCERLDQLEASFAADLDPDSDEAGVRYDELPLDAYAATDVPEFFSVATESFFTEPGRLRETYGELYDMLAAYYRQDPAQRG
jgi:Mlc titration factor MtfA (ptsG expression regulator)